MWLDEACCDTTVHNLEVSALKFVKVEFDLNEKREDTDCMELRCLDVARAYINMHRNIICTQISKNEIHEKLFYMCMSFSLFAIFPLQSPFFYRKKNSRFYFINTYVVCN
jgi:hypothetical protein